MQTVNRLSEPMVAHSSLVELLREKSGLHPERKAYTFLNNDAEIHLTYAELDAHARSIGVLLQEHSRLGDRALLLYPPGMEFIAAFFGSLYSGVIAVPVYPPNPSDLERTLPRLLAIIKDSQPTVALTTSQILPMAEFMVADQPELKHIKWLATDKLPDDAGVWKMPNVNKETLAFLQYTSGSTALPRGVMVSHGNLLHNEKMIQKAFHQSEESIIVSWLPLYHDMGLIGGALQPLYLGTWCILMSPVAFLKKPFRWLQAISRYKATTSGGPNFAYDLCVKKITMEERSTLDLSSWRTAFNGAEPIWNETLERFIDAFGPCGFSKETFFPCYGLAEATLMVTCGVKGPIVTHAVKGAELKRHRVIPANPEDEDARELVSCGKTYYDLRVAIVDPMTQNECGPEQVGEIWATGSSIAQGYWNRLEDTENTFKAYIKGRQDGPYLRTGDLGFLKDGQLYITGRLKDLIIIRGKNHYPQDIEWSVEKSSSQIRPGCCAAFGIEVDGHEELVVVAEVDQRNQNDQIDAKALAFSIRRSISEHHKLKPYAVTLLKTGAIPKTSSGKVQRHACRNAFLSGTLEPIGEDR